MAAEPVHSSATSAGAAHRSLEQSALRATVWTMVAYGSTQVLRMGSSIVLTRLLVPEYFGLMALMSTLILGMTLLSDVGLLPSVVNSPRGDDPAFLNTAWTVQIVRGFALWLICVTLSFPLSYLYHDHRILRLLPVLGFSMVLGGLASSNMLSIARHMLVRRQLLIDFITQMTTIAVTIAWAWKFPTVWALVGGTLTGVALKTTLSHMPAVLPGIRNSLAWEKESLHSLLHFGKWILLGTAFYFFASQADRLILGKLVPFAVLGVYNIAFIFADIPRQVIQQFSNRVGFPFVAKLARLPLAEFRDNVMRYRLMVLSAGACILSIVVNGGGPLVLRLYDTRYHAASWMVPVLALGLWHTLMYSTTSNILLALGKPKYNAIGTGCFCATMFIALPVAFHFFGLFGAVISVAAGDLPFYFVMETGAAREKVSVWRQDALATLIFLALLTVGYGIKRLI